MEGYALLATPVADGEGRVVSHINVEAAFSPESFRGW
jgi:hypothetical protein